MLSADKKLSGAYMFFGGVLLLISGIMEFVLGNTFPFAVFMSFGAFWFTFAITLQQGYGAFTTYAPPGSPDPAVGILTPGFNASFGKCKKSLRGCTSVFQKSDSNTGFLLLFMGLLCLVFLVCAFKTNLVYIVVFSSLVIAFGLLTGQHFHIATGNLNLAASLQVVSLL
jgi:succinate-acetate transporter protein